MPCMKSSTEDALNIASISIEARLPDLEEHAKIKVMPGGAKALDAKKGQADT